jgi:hypothetical protein
VERLAAHKPAGKMRSGRQDLRPARSAGEGGRPGEGRVPDGGGGPGKAPAEKAAHLQRPSDFNDLI